MKEPDPQSEINRLLAELDYERLQRYAAEMALNNTQDVRCSERPERLASYDWELEQWRS